MVFFEGDFYTARVALENLVRSANHRVIIIDGYVSSLTMSVLDVRKPEVSATVYTVGVGQGMQSLRERYKACHAERFRFTIRHHRRSLQVIGHS